MNKTHYHNPSSTEDYEFDWKYSITLFYLKSNKIDSNIYIFPNDINIENHLSNDTSAFQNIEQRWVFF